MSAKQLSWTIDHIGIATNDLEISCRLYRTTTGMIEVCSERLPDFGIEVVFLASSIESNSPLIELLAPLNNQSTIARFLQRRGPGLHHICYKVMNIEYELSRLKNLGVQLIDESPRPGARHTKIAFLHPKSFGGTLTELCQYHQS